MMDKWHLLGLIQRDCQLSCSARRTAYFIIDRYNANTQLCYPSYERMALDSGLTRRSCITGVRQLVAKGYVEIIRKGGKIGGRTLANDYRPCFELVKNKVATSVKERSEVVKSLSPQSIKEPIKKTKYNFKKREPYSNPLFSSGERPTISAEGKRMKYHWKDGSLIE